MEIVDVRNILLENNKIASVVCHKDKTYMQHSYSVFVSCELIVSGENIPIYIGIPNKWRIELVDFYIENYREFPYMPHIDTKGKICLYELEGVLIDGDIEGILNQCIQKAISIILEGLEGINKSDFIDEFSLYWCQFPNIRCANCDIPTTQETQLIKYVENTVKRGKKEKYVSYIEKSKRASIFASYNSKAFELWNISGTQRNGGYVYVNLKNYKYPPDARRELDVAYINELLLCVPVKDVAPVFSKFGSNKLLIFCIVQPNGIENYIGVFLKNVNIYVEGNCYQLGKTDSTEIYPLSVHRLDKKFLMNRVNSDRKTFSGLKWLVIGCGSIGGYLVNEIIKAGADRITLVDSDKMQSENIYRHLLGAEYVGQYKAEALAQYFGKNMPEVKMIPYDEDICDLLEEENIQLNDFDIIISATGNHNVNRWINMMVQEIKCDIPVIYVWNEPLDLGCHVAVINSANKGCYECFFDRNPENEELFDKVAYCVPGQNITKNIMGCGSAFVPYASTVSLKSTALCMDIVSAVVDGRCEKNVIVSMKGAGYYFTKTGYKVFVGAEEDYNIVEDESIEIRGISDSYTSSVNLVLSDTYPISKGMLPASTSNLSTIWIVRIDSKKMVRTFSKKFCNTIKEVVSGLPNNVETIHLFSTLNPKHSFGISNNVFKMAGRCQVKALKVFPQSNKNGNWNFVEKGVIIYDER